MIYLEKARTNCNSIATAPACGLANETIQAYHSGMTYSALIENAKDRDLNKKMIRFKTPEASGTGFLFYKDKTDEIALYHLVWRDSENIVVENFRLTPEMVEAVTEEERFQLVWPQA